MTTTTTDFASFIEQERSRLNAEREKLLGDRAEIDNRIGILDTELGAISAYEAVKSGKMLSAPAKMVRHRQRHGSKRDQLLQLVRDVGDQGISRGDILVRMGLKGDKSGEMSVSNALTALTKSNALVRRGGKYLAVGI